MVLPKRIRGTKEPHVIIIFIPLNNKEMIYFQVSGVLGFWGLGYRV